MADNGASRLANPRSAVKLAAKLVVVLVLGLIAAMAIEGYVFVQREKTLFRREMQQDVLLIGDAIKGPLAETWREKGEGRALQMIADANQGEHIANIRWVWFADAAHPDRTPQLSASESRDVAGGNRQFFERRDQKGNPQLVGYLPVAPSGPAEGALEVSKPLSHLDARLNRSISRIVVMSGTIVVGGGIAVVLLGTRWIGVPLSQVMSKLRRVGEGDLAGPLELQRSDELGELAGAINSMCTQLAEHRERIRQETAARIDALENLRHADRLSTVGKLAAGVAHELRHTAERGRRPR